MASPIAGFDWDEANREKCQKHGVPLATIEALFEHEIVVIPDPEHSRGETRFKAIGLAGDGRHVLIVFTLRLRDDGRRIRPISARYMHAKEVRHYEKEAAKAAKR